MSTSTLRLKNEKGWFAAGVEVDKALRILSDGAFKLFVYLCLTARRDQGSVETSQLELAQALNKGTQTIRKYLHQMQEAGVCRLSGFAPVPYCRGRIEITDEYWPYHRRRTPPPNQEATKFVEDIQALVQQRACVRASWSTADEILARQWLEQGLSIQRIEQAIVLGCARKYVAWRNNHQHSTPIATLRYFEPLLEEINQLEIPPDYWTYVRSRMQRMEKLWIQSRTRPDPLETESERSAESTDLGQTSSKSPRPKTKGDDPA